MRDAAFVKACELVDEFRKQAERLRSEVESLRAKLASRTVEWPEWAKAGTRVVVKSCDSYHTAAAQADAEPGFEFVIAEIDRGDSTVGDGKGTWASIFDLEPVAEHVAPAAFAELHRKHKEAERTLETERDQLRVERDALRAQLDTERQKVREWIAENKRLQTETAERGVEIASLQVRLRQVPRTHPVPCDPPEATHITPDGKATATAQAAVTPQPGDVVRLVRVPTQEEYPDWDDEFGVVGSEGIVRSASPQCANVYYSGVIWAWPLWCVEVVKGDAP